MHWVILIAIALFLLFTCQQDEQAARAAEKQRIEQEVNRRVKIEVAQKEAAIEKKYSVRAEELRTVRTAGYILLAGGSLAGLLRLLYRRSRIPVQPREPGLEIQTPVRRAHRPEPTIRVIDLQPPSSPASQGTWMDTNILRRGRALRRHHRNRNHGNQDQDQPPRHH